MKIYKEAIGVRVKEVSGSLADDRYESTHNPIRGYRDRIDSITERVCLDRGHPTEDGHWNYAREEIDTLWDIELESVKATYGESITPAVDDDHNPVEIVRVQWIDVNAELPKWYELELVVGTGWGLRTLDRLSRVLHPRDWATFGEDYKDKSWGLFPPIPFVVKSSNVVEASYDNSDHEWKKS